jgi:hypothetical protein
MQKEKQEDLGYECENFFCTEVKITFTNNFSTLNAKTPTSHK